MEALGRHHIDTDFVSLREQTVSRPLLAHILNAPLLRRRAADSDFIHAGGNATYAAVGLKLFTRVRIIHDVHGDSVSEERLKSARSRNWRSLYQVAQAWIVDAAAYRYADYSLVVSRPSRRRLVEERHLLPEKIGLVRNGVDLELFRRPSKPRLEGGDLVVGYAGGFQPWQGISTLVRAMEMVDKGVSLKIVGFTKDDAALRADIASRLGGRAELLDRMPQPELISHLAAADVLVIPRPKHRAVEVAFPTKFGEYLALGKPVVVCDVDETADLVREHGCGMVSAPDPAELAATLQAMAAHNPSILHSMGCNARRLAEQEMSWDAVGSKYVQLLTKWSSPL
jgi:glycosyltransferase involved in cell wall biosynthesis